MKVCGEENGRIINLVLLELEVPVGNISTRYSFDANITEITPAQTCFLETYFRTFYVI